jgi:hypothetical protein
MCGCGGQTSAQTYSSPLKGKHCNSECEDSLSRAERVESTNRTWALKRHDEAAGKPRSDHA